MDDGRLDIQGEPIKPPSFVVLPCALLVLLGASALGVALYVLADPARLKGVNPRALSPVVGVVGSTLVLLLVALFATAVLGRKRAFSRAGRVEFKNLGIFFEKNGRRAALRWDHVAGFRDDSTEFVEIVSRTWKAHSWMFTVPTLTEKDRVAVLAWLDKKGVARIE
jgi:hypothetical protein